MWFSWKFCQKEWKWWKKWWEANKNKHPIVDAELRKEASDRAVLISRVIEEDLKPRHEELTSFRKLDPPPESPRNRWRSGHEHVLFLTKRPGRYTFHADAIRVPYAEATKKRWGPTELLDHIAVQATPAGASTWQNGPRPRCADPTWVGGSTHWRQSTTMCALL